MESPPRLGEDGGHFEASDVTAMTAAAAVGNDGNDVTSSSNNGGGGHLEKVEKTKTTFKL